MTPEVSELVERLHDHARNVGGDDSFERLYGSEAVEIATALETLEAENVALKHDLERQMTIANTECNEAIQSREMLQKVLHIAEALAGDVPVTRETWQTLREAAALLKQLSGDEQE